MDRDGALRLLRGGEDGKGEIAGLSGMEKIGLVVGIIAGLIAIFGGVYAFRGWLARKRQSCPGSREDELLVKMSETDRPAMINAHTQALRHVLIAGEQFIDQADDLCALRYLEAMDNLAALDYIDKANEHVFRLTAKGFERARSVRKCGKTMPM